VTLSGSRRSHAFHCLSYPTRLSTYVSDERYLIDIVIRASGLSGDVILAI